MDLLFFSVITYIAIAINVCNVSGNLLVIVILQKNKKLRESANNFLLIALAYADLWFSILVFVDIIILSNQLEASFAYFEFFFNALASIYIYVALAVERYFAILKPFVHMGRARKCLLRKVVLVIYSLAGVLSAPGYYFYVARILLSKQSWKNTTTTTTQVGPVWFENLSIIYSFMLFVFGLILPSALIIFCYSRVIFHVWFNANKNRATNAGLVKSRRKLTKLFLLVTVVFMITWSPTFGRLLVTPYGVHKQEKLKFELFSMLLGLVGSTANPVIYSFRCPTFRQEVVKLLSCCCCKRRPPRIGAINHGVNRYCFTKQATRGRSVEPVRVICMRKLH